MLCKCIIVSAPVCFYWVIIHALLDIGNVPSSSGNENLQTIICMLNIIVTPTRSFLVPEKCFYAIIDIMLDKTNGLVKDYVVKTEYQKHGGIYWHILFLVLHLIMYWCFDIPTLAMWRNSIPGEWNRNTRFIMSATLVGVSRDMEVNNQEGVSMAFPSWYFNWRS